MWRRGAQRADGIDAANHVAGGDSGLVCRALADAGVNIEVLYSDHDHQLIVAVDNIAAARAISDQWTSERTP